MKLSAPVSNSANSILHSKNTPRNHSPQRDGSFEFVLGSSKDVDSYLAAKQQKKDHYGQLTLNANVVESSINLEYVPPESKLLNSLVPYINFEEQSRNGGLGQNAAFVYPLREARSNQTATDAPMHLGLYVDNKDLNKFLNYVGPQRWGNAIKESADEIVRYALEYATAIKKDQNDQPITIQKIKNSKQSTTFDVTPLKDQPMLSPLSVDFWA